MCRRKLLIGCCLCAFGFGLLLGFWIGSWFWCGVGGALFIALGALLLRGR